MPGGNRPKKPKKPEYSTTPSQKNHGGFDFGEHTMNPALEGSKTKSKKKYTLIYLHLMLTLGGAIFNPS